MIFNKSRYFHINYIFKMFWDVLGRSGTLRDAQGHPGTLWDALKRSGTP